MLKINIKLLFMLSIIMILTQNGNVKAKEKLLDDEKLLIVEELRNEQVPEDKIKILLNKLENGQIWDSMNPDYSHIKPQILKNGYSKTIFPDGSLIISSIKEVDVNNKITPLTIYSRKGYEVVADWKLMKISYKVDYQRDDVNKVGRITSQYDFKPQSLLGTYDLDTADYLRGWKNPTHAWAAYNYKAYQGAAQVRYYVKVFVNGDKVWIDYSS